MKQYKNFLEFYNDAFKFSMQISDKLTCFRVVQKIIFARKEILKDVLNSYILIGVLSDEIVKILKSKTKVVKLSMDNLIKNILTHPEISLDDYKKIPDIVKNPSKYSKNKTEYDVILYKADNKFYKLVIKTTKNRKEIFVKSLHLLNKERYEKY